MEPNEIEEVEEVEEYDYSSEEYGVADYDGYEYEGYVEYDNCPSIVKIRHKNHLQ